MQGNQPFADQMAAWQNQQMHPLSGSPGYVPQGPPAAPVWPQQPPPQGPPPGWAPPSAPQAPPPQWPQQPQAPQAPPGWAPPPPPQGPPPQAPYAGNAPQYGGAVPDYTGVTGSRDKFPKATPGAQYVFEIVETDEIVIEGKSRTWRAELKVEYANPQLHNVGDTVVILQSLDTEKSRKIGYGEIKKFCAAAMAAESEGQFDSMPNWQHLCAATHFAGKQINPYFGANPLKGKKIRVIITPTGKLAKDGSDYGRNVFLPQV